MANLPFFISGVRGGNLATRIEEIVANRRRSELTRTRRAALVLAAITFGVGPVVAGALMQAPRQQPPASDRLRFEVASVKRNTSGRGPYQLMAEILPGGRMRATNAPLVVLIASAYGVSPKEIDAEKVDLEGMYDLDARAGVNLRAADGSAEGNRELRLMLQSLLTDRLKLKIRRETRDSPVYALVVAPGGPHLKAAPADRPCDAPCGRVAGGPASGLRGESAEIGDLVTSLTFFQDRQIVDRTGLRGRFDIDVPPWTPFTQPPANSNEAQPDPSGPSLFTVLQERLGLKLEATHAPRDIYVVDHVEALSEN